MLAVQNSHKATLLKRVSPLTTSQHWSILPCVRLRLVLLLGCLLLTSGCKVGSEFHGVEPPRITPEYFGGRGLQVGDNSYLAHWWRVFNDPTLDLLLHRAGVENYSLQEAFQRFQAARARVCIADANFGPTGGPTLEYEYRKRSASAQPFAGQNTDSFNFISVGFDSAWEIDLFGKLARSREAAYADLDSAGHSHDEIRISLLAEVASTYVQIRLNQIRLEQARRILRIQNETLTLVEGRAESGVSSTLDSAQANSFRHRTEASVRLIQQQIDLEFNRLAVLLGGVSQDELRGLVASGPIPFPLIAGAGIPANLLRLRPDVKRAEADVAAASARIGVAQADLYPQLNLLGTISLDAQSISDLFMSESIAHSVGPSFSWRILDFRRIHCNVDQQRAIMQERIAAYRSAVVNAVREVEDGLAQYHGEINRSESLLQAIKYDEDAVTLAVERYEVGKANFQRVLDSQQQLLQDMSDQSTAMANASIQMIRTFKAAGGGWDVVAPPENFFSPDPVPVMQSFVTPTDSVDYSNQAPALTLEDVEIMEEALPEKEPMSVPDDFTPPASLSPGVADPRILRIPPLDSDLRAS